MIIIGIDPGVAKVGYGVIRKTQKKLKCLAYGVVETSAELSPGERLKKIEQGLNKLIRQYQPSVLAVENIYFFKNLKTAIPVSQVKGIILLSASKKGIPVYEFSPSQVKMTICGYGRADKTQVQRMIKEVLELKTIPGSDDATDALAIALCCVYLS